MKQTFEKTVESYFRYSAVMSNAHYDMAEKYRKRYRLFGIIVVTVTSIVGTTVFTSLGESPDTRIQLFTGLLSIGAAVLSALQTFLGFSELQAQHKRAGDGYSISRRDFEFLMMKYPTANGITGESGTSELEALKKNLDELDRASPTIPDKIYDAAVAKTPVQK
ncbi:MAG: SLATT domain-containing protein [Pseudomonadota bacterium]|nr:SLATT domain-containing protein [Pseudomonadota bacterium]